MLQMTAALLLVLVPPLWAAEPTGEAKKAYEAAYKQMKEKKHREACALYEKAAKLAPDSQEIWIEYTVCLRTKDDKFIKSMIKLLGTFAFEK